MGKRWERAAALRRDFADLFESLSDDQFDAPTSCGTWTPRHLLAHLVVLADLGFGPFMLAMAKARFDYDRAADALARRHARRPVDELLAELRAAASKPAKIPVFPEELTMADVAIHTQDVRRAVGAPGELRADDVEAILTFLVEHRQAKNVYDPTTIDGLRLSAPDIGWSHGTGPVVDGNGEALMMALAGRPTLDELGGDGLDTLRARLG